LLAFTNIYFFESGLFNGLRRIQIKKFAPSSGSPRRLWANASDSRGFSSPFRLFGEQEQDSAKANTLHIFPILSSEFAAPSSIAVGRSRAELSGLTRLPHAKDPNASEFRFEYGGISLTCIASIENHACLSSPDQGPAKTLGCLAASILPECVAPHIITQSPHRVDRSGQILALLGVLGKERSRREADISDCGSGVGVAGMAGHFCTRFLHSVSR
jgi:hypothetical protein